MKRKVLLCAAVAGAILLIAMLVRRPAFLEAASPDGAYHVRIQARSGWELLNAPEYLTITIQKAYSLERRTIYAQIDNDDRSITPENNVRIIWEENKLILILLGVEQRPEFITVALERGFPCERHQYDLSQEASDAMLESYGIAGGRN